MPIQFNNYVYGEPNDSCSEAKALTLNDLFYFLPDDKDDWYHFSLPRSGDLRVVLTNFTPIAGQITVWRGSCAALTFLGNNGDFTATKIVELGLQPAGSYYAWVITDGSFTNTEAYELTIDFD